MAALTQDFYIEQGADWPGTAFYIVDASGNPKTLNSSMVASGSIAGPTGASIFTWSNTPAAGQGLVVYQGNLFIPQVTAGQNAPWTFKNAQYQLFLFDPAGPAGDQTIRVGRGTVYLDRKIGS